MDSIFLILEVGCLAIAVGFFTARFILTNGKEEIPAEISYNMRVLQEGVEALSGKITILEEQLENYFNSIQSACKGEGLVQLAQIRDSLVIALEDAQHRIKTRQYDKALELTRYLRGGGHLNSGLMPATRADLKRLIDWKTKAAALILEICLEVDKSARGKREVGVNKRSTKRQSTISALNIVRENLNLFN